MKTMRRAMAIPLIAAILLLPGCDAPTDSQATQRMAASIIASPSSITLERGEDRSLQVSVLSASGSLIPDAPARFASSEWKIASVSATGIVRAQSAGTAAITVTSGAARAVVAVTVTDPYGLTPTSIYADTTVIALGPGDSTRVVLAVLNKWNELITSPIVAWTSSSPTVATVSASGIVRGVAVGTATVTATAGGLSRSFAVMVRPTVLMIEGTDRLIPGAEAPLRFGVFDSASRTLRAVIPATWTSSDSSVVSVSASGLARALRRGTVIITASAGTGTATSTIDVSALPGTIAYRLRSNVVSFLPLDGSAPTSVVMGNGIGNLALSPDGKVLAYDCGSGVCVMTVATRAPRTLIPDASDPSWTGDGKGVAVRSDFAQMKIIDVPSGSVAAVRAYHYVMKPRVSFDGARLVYGCDHLQPYEDLTDLCIVPTNGARDALFFPNAYDAAWSPRGDSLAFVTEKILCLTSRSQPACGGDPRRMCAQDVFEPAWSPDGAFLVVVRSGSLWITDPTGRTCMRLGQANSSGEPIATPSWGNGVPPAP
ncbi:MAG: Ig-like domain-containing protein [Gemmatimonadaceae bacterium]|nr:Ig-like domain-containing protein [Gemmatimonadaceae bacterium]